MSPSAYYQRATGARSARAIADDRLLAVIRQTHKDNFDAYGYRKMWKALLRAGETVPRCQVQRLMRIHGIRSAKRRGKPWRILSSRPTCRKTTNSGSQENRMTGPARSVIVGIDTHKPMHVAVAVSDQGERLAELLIVADRGGYEQLLGWARTLGRVRCFGIEGAGSYGRGLCSYLRRHDQSVIEAGRPDRRDRRLNSKSDTLDAENAARAVLAGRATATPRRAEGTSEILRQTKVAKDTAVKARTQAIITLKTLVVTAPDELRAGLDRLSKAAPARSMRGAAPGARHDAAGGGQERDPSARSSLDRARD